MEKKESEKDKMLRGEWYDANYDENLLNERKDCLKRCEDFNREGQTDEQRAEALQRLLPNLGQRTVVLPPLRCDYGYNIRTGADCFVNYNTTLLDAAPITLGNNVFVGPDCGFYTAIHPLDAKRRNDGLERAQPITLGNNVWIGGHTTILPGVTIGDGSVIGAGSVVTRNIPPHVVAVGNPCRVLKPIADGKTTTEE